MSYYCPSCGKKRVETENFCEACGYSFNQSKKIDEKDKKILELENKVDKLEKIIDQKKDEPTNNSSPWIFIFPLCFFIIFFGFFFLLVVFI